VNDHVPGDAWTDGRLDAAFHAIASRPAPAGLEARVLAGLDARPPRRWLALPGLALGGVAAVVLVAVVGTSLLGGFRGGPLGSLAVRDGGDGTRVLDAGEFSFAFPAEWSAVDSGASYSGGSSIAVLGTLPVDPRCGSGHVDVNCVSEDRLEPGTVRVMVGTASYRTGSILDEPAFEGSWEALTVDGMPARLDQPAIQPDDFYRSDLALTLSVARPAGFGHVVTIELLAREPGIEAARAAMDTIIETFHYAEPPPVLPLDDAAGRDIARRVLAASDEVLRQSIGAGSGATPYSCQPDDPGQTAEAEIGSDFGSALGGIYPARCSWTIERPSGDRFWRLTVYAEWDVGDHENAGTEEIWVDAAGNVMGRRVDQLSATPTAPPQTAAPVRADGLPSVDNALGLPVLTVGAALDVLAGDPGDREIAVMGWWPGDPRVECPLSAGADSSPAYPRCPDQLRYLTADREALLEVTSDTATGHPPSGPSLTLHFRDGAAPPATAFPADGVVAPVPLLVLGHIADHRAALCPEEMRRACESAFIVDLALDPGDPVWPGRLDDLDAAGVALEPAGSEDVAVTLALQAAGMRAGIEPPVVAILRLSPAAVARVEPALAAPSGMAPAGVTWIVKLLIPDGGGRVRAFAIGDAAVAGYPDTLTTGVDVYRPTAGGVQVTSFGQSDAAGSSPP
jgi:hypothetical protein